MTAADIPAGLIGFTVVILGLIGWLGGAALGKRDGYRQDERDAGRSNSQVL